MFLLYLFIPEVGCLITTSKLFTSFGSSLEYLEPRSLYFFQVWGAGAFMSKGGYASGYLYVQDTTKIYVTVGEKGGTCTTSGQTLEAFNGGGSCQSSGMSVADYYSGGGSSDIRILANSIYNRVIVAGGAGGSDNLLAFGGGSIGGASTGNGDGKAGTQTSAGTTCVNSDGCQAGSFGSGADAVKKGNGGGGGWYGGASGDAPTVVTAGSAGGGSGFALTLSNYLYQVPNGYIFKGNKTYLLTNTLLIGGNKPMPSPYGGNETGQSGNGAAKITKIKTIEIPWCTIKLNIIKKNKISAASIITITLSHK